MGSTHVHTNRQGYNNDWPLSSESKKNSVNQSMSSFYMRAKDPPWQYKPMSVKPSLHVHTYDPSVFKQSAFEWHSFSCDEIHSSRSEILYIKCEMTVLLTPLYIRGNLNFDRFYDCGFKKSWTMLLAWACMFPKDHHKYGHVFDHRQRCVTDYDVIHVIGNIRDSR